jgi:hypothetical protein
MRKRLAKEESNRERFIRLGTLRTNAVLRSLKILGNCSNKYVYEYTEHDINKIFAEIDKALKETKAKFRSNRRKEFKL